MFLRRSQDCFLNQVDDAESERRHDHPDHSPLNRGSVQCQRQHELRHGRSDEVEVDAIPTHEFVKGVIAGEVGDVNYKRECASDARHQHCCTGLAVRLERSEP